MRARGFFVSGFHFQAACTQVHAADARAGYLEGMLKTNRVLILLLLILTPFTALGAHELDTWVMEVAPIFIAIPFLWHFARTGRLSPFLMSFLFVFGLILMLGGHYTYARVPLGEWIRDLGIGERNNYDKIGHFFQGVIPALVAREAFLRQGLWRRHPLWLGAVTILASVGVSGLYEIVEMTGALLLGAGADDFLGTQGYVWDAQTDMLMALLGAVVAAVSFNGVHARSVARENQESRVEG